MNEPTATQSHTRFGGRYELLRPLGRGAMGEVFLARDLATGAECALKRLRARPGADLSEIRKEFEALSRVRHPAVVAVHAFGVAPDGTPYYTMEFFSGRSADQALAVGDWPSFYRVAADAVHGIEALHAAEVVHGDVKPGNLLVAQGPDGKPAGVRLLDFGLAAILDRETRGARGTPGFAAPEVVAGGPPTRAADLYGLGATLYRLASGRGAFGEESIAAVLKRQSQSPPGTLPLESAGASPGLIHLILRLMAEDPRERPADAQQVRSELETLHEAGRRPLVERLRMSIVVGRERELARLGRRLARSHGRVRIALLTGPPGIGKSSLLAELATRASLFDRIVVRLDGAARTGPGEGARALLGALAAEAGESIDRMAGIPETVRRFVVDGVAPSAEPRAAAPPDPLAMAREAMAISPGDTEGERGVTEWSADGPATLERGISEWVAAAVAIAARIAKRSALVLLVDDADRLDPASRWFVRRFALHPAMSKAVWVWAQHGLATGSNGDDAVLLDTGVATRIELEPLDAESIGRLAAARLREPARANLVEFLWARGQGHPGLTVELLLGAAQQGAIRDEAAGLIADPARLERLGLPDSFEASLVARTMTLAEPARNALMMMSLVGRPMTREELRQTDGSVDAADLRALIEAGLARDAFHDRVAILTVSFGERLVKDLEESDRQQRCRRALLLSSLSAETRFRLLRGAGDPRAALEAAAEAYQWTHSIALAEQAAELAAAEVPERLAEWQDRAARAYMARGRFGAAIPHLKRAIEHGSLGPSQAERFVALSGALVWTGRFPEVGEAVERGLAAQPSAVQTGRLLINDAARLQGIGQVEESARVIERAVAQADGTGRADLVTAAARTRVLILRDLGRIDEAEKAVEEALEIAERSGNPVEHARTLGARAAIARARFETAQAVRLYREARDLAEGLDARLVVEESLHGLTAACGEHGDWRAMREANRDAARIAMEDQRRLGVALAVSNLAVVEGLTGRPRSAWRWSRSAIRLARRAAPWLEAQAWRARSMAHGMRGRWRRAVMAGEKAIELARKSSLSYELEWSRIETGRAHAASGRWDLAATLFDRAVDAPLEPQSVAAAILVAFSGRAALRRGEFARAEAALDAADRWLGEHTAPYADAFADLLRAELRVRQGDPLGIEYGNRALEKFLALPALPARAEGALALADLALEANRDLTAAALDWAEVAAAAFAQLGHRRGRERALVVEVAALRRLQEDQPTQVLDRDLLASVSRLLNSITDLHELMHKSLELVVRQLRAERGVLLLLDEESKQLEPILVRGTMDTESREEAVTYSRGVVRRVTESGGSLLIGDAASEPGRLSESMVNMRLRSIVCVPLFLGGRVIGAVYLDDSRRAQVFADPDRSLLEGFAQLMAVAIEKSRGHQDVQRTNEQLLEENLSLRREATIQFQPHRLIGTSQAMQRALAVAERAAQTAATVLLTGENGTGKELIARILHHNGKRRHGPFVAVNCGAIPETLLESELFGILPNVATGVSGRGGRFQQADGGTLFLDEVGDMPLGQQVALLSAIANREITPVGGGKAIAVDVRLIAATNRDLRRMIEVGQFREDLFYRLNVIPIEVPPLRERKADIPSLAHYFAAQLARQQEREVPELSPEFLAALMQSDWPGNVRELQNYLERIMALNPGNVLRPNPLPRDLEERGETVRLRGKRLPDMVEELEKRMLKEALSRTGGNQSLAARELGVPEQAIRYRMKKYGILRSRENRRNRAKWR